MLRVMAALMILLIAAGASAGEKPEPDVKTLKAENAGLRAQVERLARDYRRARLDREKANNRLRIGLEQIQVLTRQLSVMRDELRQTRKVVMALKEREAVLRVNNLELVKKCSQLKMNYRRVAIDLGYAKNVLRQLTAKGVKLPPVRLEVPDVRSQVSAVDAKAGRVTLEGGGNLDIKRGFVFIIYRRVEGRPGEKRVARAKITAVAEHACTATVIERTEAIKVGDAARTDLKAPWPKLEVEFDLDKPLPAPIPKEAGPVWKHRVKFMGESGARLVKELEALLAKPKIAKRDSERMVASVRAHHAGMVRSLQEAYTLVEIIQKETAKLKKMCGALKALCDHYEKENERLKKGGAPAPKKGKPETKPPEAF